MLIGPSDDKAMHFQAAILNRHRETLQGKTDPAKL